MRTADPETETHVEEHHPCFEDLLVVSCEDAANHVFQRSSFFDIKAFVWMT
jgi:hypothetical protein